MRHVVNSMWRAFCSMFYFGRLVVPLLRHEFEGTPLFFLHEGGECYAECVEFNRINMCKNEHQTTQISVSGISSIC